MPFGRARLAGTVSLLILSLGSFALGAYWGEPLRAMLDGPQPKTAAVPEKKAPSASSDERAKHAEWIGKLRGGGYILFLRHANREQWAEVRAFDAYALASGTDASKSFFKGASCLSSVGLAEAKLMGELFRILEIKVGPVLSSPSCRSMQTAQIAFGRIDAVKNSLLYPGALTGKGPVKPEAAEKVRRILLGIEIPAGANAVVSAHGSMLDIYKERVVQADKPIKPVDETGFYVLARENGALRLVHQFQSLSDLVGSLKMPSD